MIEAGKMLEDGDGRARRAIPGEAMREYDDSCTDSAGGELYLERACWSRAYASTYKARSEAYDLASVRECFDAALS